ncbi:MAG: methyltransferase family protein [Candidatus Sulfotelmatobacter sp.]
MQARYQILTAFQIVAACALVWGLATWPTPWNVQRDIGTALVVVGISCIVMARLQLGKSFSITAQARQLVTAGIYSKIRNPIYVFGAVTIAGVILVVQKPVLWVVLFILLILQTLRARREARVLEAAFGDAYREYRRKTWF